MIAIAKNRIFGSVLVLLLTGIFNPSLLSAKDQPTDYKFYKKYGHSKKTWNEHVKAGFIAYDAQDCKTALQHLKEAVSLQCQDGLVYFKLAVCTELMEIPYTAIQYYQLAQEKLHQLDTVHRYQKEIFENYGRALFNTKRYREALPHLTRATVIGDPSFGLFYMTAITYQKAKDAAAARDYFARALTQDLNGISPQILSEVYLEVARAHLEDKKLKEANDMLEKALKENPQNRTAAKLRKETSHSLHQISIGEMLEKLSIEASGGEELPKIQPPPPAASKLPPLEGVPSERTPKLEPLPPAGPN